MGRCISDLQRDRESTVTTTELSFHARVYNIVPEMPEKEMADGLILQGSTEKEFSKLTIKVGLKFEYLYQLK